MGVPFQALHVSVLIKLPSFLHYPIYSSLSETAASLSVIISPTVIPPLVVARLRRRVQSSDNVPLRLLPGQQLFLHNLIFQVSLSFVQTQP